MMPNRLNEHYIQAAIYCRLSKEDEKKGESGSIETQKEMISDFVKSKGWNIYKIYVDDGFSGLHSSSRPAFQELLSDAEERKFDIVITKDLSRLGRNYIETGTYIEDFFPRLGIRYIALNDGVDTLHDNNEIVPFKNVLNEFYSRDVSKKVKSGYLTRAKQGKFTGCLAPFGYMKDEDDPHVLVPDPDTAWIIEKIFELAAQGYGVQAIRTQFIKERIETPTWWNRQKGLRNCVTKWEKKRPEDGRFIWDESTIKEIIESPVYIGHMASHKVKYKFKIGLIGDRPRDEWIVVKDTHEPIVSDELYERANMKLKSRKRSFKTGELSIFAGLVKCPDCGKALNIGRNNSKKQERIMTCNTYRRYGKDFCSQHRIFYDDLYNVILDDIRKNAENVSLDEDKILKAILKNARDSEDNEKIELEENIEEMSKRYKTLESKVERLYDDWTEERISEMNFQKILEKTQKEQTALYKKIKSLEEIYESYENDDIREHDVKKWINLIEKYRDVEELDRTMLNELIERIYVYEKEVDEEGEVTQVVEIFYNFIGNNSEVVLNYDC